MLLIIIPIIYLFCILHSISFDLYHISIKYTESIINPYYGFRKLVQNLSAGKYESQNSKSVLMPSLRLLQLSNFHILQNKPISSHLAIIIGLCALKKQLESNHLAWLMKRKAFTYLKKVDHSLSKSHHIHSNSHRVGKSKDQAYRPTKLRP